MPAGGEEELPPLPAPPKAELVELCFTVETQAGPDTLCPSDSPSNGER